MRPRLLIFIVAYHAEATLERVLDRLPADLFETYDTEVLVIDDASSDATFEIGLKYRKTHAGLPLTVLRNTRNLGYGGNQKVGYTYAIERGFDLVALVHGDGQYAPEELSRLCAPIRAGHAEAVFGSRFLTPGAALRGGMPLYKFVGNRILTFLQNRLLGTRLSEFHSGYRIYSVAALKRIPFRLSSNDFHFDTEIIIQLLAADLRIVELPIPTYYGTEISRVNGLKYALQVVLATARFVAHRMGIIWQRRYQPLVEDNRHYTQKLGYASSHQWALDAVPPGSSVLDVGAGPVGLTERFLEKGCSVTVVDRCPVPSIPPSVQMIVQDLDDPLLFPLAPYSHVLLLDVVEHLRDPESFLERFRELATHEAKTVIISVPNVAFFPLRLLLLFGQFNYGKAGILDRTHSRLFTFRGLRRLLNDEGYRVVSVRGVPAPFPKALGDGFPARLLLGLNLVAIRVSKSLFAYQCFFVTETTPGIRFLLRDALASAESLASAPPPPQA
ncbi:MAG: glycosyltransferase [Acidobacteria bacterium]|nr:glycosyltransferase [Acidobacteriota bacterium]